MLDVSPILDVSPVLGVSTWLDVWLVLGVSPVLALTCLGHAHVCLPPRMPTRLSGQ